MREIREIGADAANDKLAELRVELAKTRSQSASRTRPEKPGKAKSVRKTIARLLTVMREKEILAAKNDMGKNKGKATGGRR